MSDEATPGGATRLHGRLHLPRPRRLIGRESELREVRESIALSPVTTLTGPGGVDGLEDLHVERALRTLGKEPG